MVIYVVYVVQADLSISHCEKKICKLLIKRTKFVETIDLRPKDQ